MDWMVLQTAAATTVMLPLIVYTSVRRDDSGLSRTLMWLLVMIMLWAIGMAIGDRPGVPRSVAMMLTVPPACFMSPLFLLLMLRYARSGPFIGHPKSEWALLAPFVIYMLIFLTNDMHGWMRDPLDELTTGPTSESATPLFWAFQFGSNMTAVAGLVVCGGLTWNAATAVTRRSMALVTAAATLPLITHLLWIFDLTPLEFPLTPGALAITSCLIVTAILRYRLLDVQPIARRDVIEASTNAIIVADVDQVIVDVNPAAAQMLGMERSLIVGHSLRAVAGAFECTDPEDALVSVLQELEEGRAPERLEVKAKDGRTFEISSGRPIDPDGVHAGYFLVISDRSSERQAQQLLYQSQKLESIGILAAGVAHEVNNPLSFVRANFEHLGQLSMMVENKLDQLPKDLADQLLDVPEIVEESVAGLNRIQAVVQGLLGFSRMPTQQNDDLECNRVVGEALRFAALGPKGGVTVERDLESDLPPIAGVEEQLVQVLLNLVLNAKKSLEGLPDPCIWVSTHLEDGRIEIRVQDNGPGVPEEIRDQIFDPFFTTRDPNQGTGLGLAIAFDIVRDHNGELLHEAPAEGGARFIVKLPIGPDTASDAQSSPDVQSPPE